MTKEHQYEVGVKWTGNPGHGTIDAKSYERAHEIRVEGKPVLSASADTIFRGDATRHNPEDLLVASVSACHMLWYLHLCADAGVVVAAYEDAAVGTLSLGGGPGEFTGITLRPTVVLAPDMDAARAEALHERAHELCFIANSLKCPVRVEPKVKVGESAAPA